MSVDEITRLNTLASAHARAGRIQAALDAYHQLALLIPNDYRVHHNLGVVYSLLPDDERALECLYRAEALRPDDPAVHHNLATVLISLGRFSEAIDHEDKAIAAQADFAPAHHCRGMIHLMLGDFERGWADMEWRLRSPNLALQPRRFAEPRWDGSDLCGKTILLHAEQGLGDTIQFVRYASLVARKGGRVIVECQPAIADLVRTVSGVSQVLAADRFLAPEDLPPFDVYSSLLSLPRILGTRLETIPNRVPYINAGAKADFWKDRLAPERRLRVGLAWAGGPAHIEDRTRSISLKDFAGLASVPNIAFYSLQKGPASAQAASPPTGLNLIDYTSELNDFADTAGLISNLDLVISVDTAVAHLAGALGRPVWTLLTWVPDCRWMLDRVDSPWYPTMRLFRQPSRGDWAGAIRQVAAALSLRS